MSRQQSVCVTGACIRYCWIGPTRWARRGLDATAAQTEHTPGLLAPARTSLSTRYPILPTRADVVEHLNRHAHEDGIAVQLDTEVHRIDRRSGGWRLQTSRGIVDAPHVVVATGYEHTPVIPDWPGKAGFTGEIVHSAHYRNPTPYLGKRVLVVGGGSSGFEIVTDVATGGAAKAWLSFVRRPTSCRYGIRAVL